MYNMILCFRHPCPSISPVKQANIWRDMTYWWCQYSAGLDMVQPHLTYIVPVRASRYTLITQHNNTYHHQHCSLKTKIHSKIEWQGQVKMNKKTHWSESDKYAAIHIIIKSSVMIMFARKHIFSFVEFSNSQPTLNFMHRSKDLFGFQADIFPVIPLQSLHSSGK